MVPVTKQATWLVSCAPALARAGTQHELYFAIQNVPLYCFIAKCQLITRLVLFVQCYATG
jgi:hypothetical protein